MRLVAISDTHNRHHEISLPDGDILIHAGDATLWGTLGEMTQFINWFSAQPHKIKIFVAGNHDLFAEQMPHLFKSSLPENIMYLENQYTTVENLKIYGSPYTPVYGSWAFSYERKDAYKYWERIDSVDILITHGQPYGINDTGSNRLPAGCPVLLENIERIKPKLYIGGHLHKCRNTCIEKNGTLFANVAQCNSENNITNGKPFVIDTDTWNIINENS